MVNWKTVRNYHHFLLLQVGGKPPQQFHDDDDDNDERDCIMCVSCKCKRFFFKIQNVLKVQYINMP